MRQLKWLAHKALTEWSWGDRGRVLLAIEPGFLPAVAERARVRLSNAACTQRRWISEVFRGACHPEIALAPPNIFRRWEVRCHNRICCGTAQRAKAAPTG